MSRLKRIILRERAENDAREAAAAAEAAGDAARAERAKHAGFVAQLQVRFNPWAWWFGDWQAWLGHHQGTACRRYRAGPEGDGAGRITLPASTLAGMFATGVGRVLV